MWNLLKLSKGSTKEDKKLITSAHHLIFLDDVLISGTRIRGYLKSLREEFSGDDLSKSLEKITWFPIIARPSDAKGIVQIKDSLSGHRTPWRNEFTFLYEIILPEWTDDKLCPWCQEATVFQNEVGGKLFEEPSWYAERRNYLLYSTEEGISENPLFLLPGVLNRRVGSGSRIAEEGSSEMQVLFLLATALQNLRNNAMNPLGPSLMQSNVLSMIGKGEEMDVFTR